MHQATAKELIDAGLSKSFAYFVVSGDKTPTVPLALWLLDECGLAVPPLSGKAKHEIDVLRSMYPPQAPKSILRRRAARSESQGVAA